MTDRELDTQLNRLNAAIVRMDEDLVRRYRGVRADVGRFGFGPLGDDKWGGFVKKGDRVTPIIHASIDDRLDFASALAQLRASLERAEMNLLVSIAQAILQAES